MITSIELQNFKGHKHTTLELEESRLHAIVGPNSSGKTSILQAMDCLGQLAKRPFSEIFHSTLAPAHVVTAGQKWFTVGANGSWGVGPQGWDWKAGYRIERLDDGYWHPDTFRNVRDSESATWITDDNFSEREWSSSLQDAPHPIPTALGYTTYLKLVVSNLARPEYSDELIPQVGFDGSGLAPALDYLRSDNPQSLEEIVDMLRHVVPSVRGIDVRRAKVETVKQRTIEVDGKTFPYDESREVIGQEIVFDMTNGARIPSHAISEGTLLVLGLLTALFTSKALNLVLLDDIEQALHPKAQREVIGLLKRILAVKPTMQIVFTTHSPYIIDALNPSQVHVLNLSDGGYTMASRLDEHPDIDWTIQTLTTGEFWDAEGEEWVLREPSDV